jgi:hypothetical protein
MPLDQIVEPPEVDTLPDAPHRGDPAATFSADAAAFTGALPAFGTQMDGAAAATYQNALSAYTDAQAAAASAEEAQAFAEVAEGFASVATAATDYISTSSSTVTVAAGTRTFALDDPVAAAMATAGAIVTAIRFGDPETRVSGAVQGGSTTSNLILSVPSDGVVGSGSHDDWFVMLAAFAGVGATKADMLAVETSQAAVTPLAIKESLEPFALTDGPTVTPDNSDGLDFTWTIGGNRTLAAIVNTYPGARGEIEITQDGTGSRVLAWASGVYKRKGGLPVLSTAAGAKDYLNYTVKTVDGSNVATLVIVRFTKAPTN